MTADTRPTASSCVRFGDSSAARQPLQGEQTDKEKGRSFRPGLMPFPLLPLPLAREGRGEGLPYLASSTCSNSSSTGVARPKIDTPTLTPLTFDQAFQFLCLHQKSVRQGWHKPHRRKRRNESDAYVERLRARWTAKAAASARYEETGGWRLKDWKKQRQRG